MSQSSTRTSITIITIVTIITIIITTIPKIPMTGTGHCLQFYNAAWLARTSCGGWRLEGQQMRHSGGLPKERRPHQRRVSFIVSNIQRHPGYRGQQTQDRGVPVVVVIRQREMPNYTKQTRWCKRSGLSALAGAPACPAGPPFTAETSTGTHVFDSSAD